MSVMDEKTSNLHQIARIEVHKLKSGKWGRLRLPIQRQEHPFRVSSMYYFLFKKNVFPDFVVFIRTIDE